MEDRIRVDTILDKNYLLPGSSETVYLMVRLKAPEHETENRTAQNLGFVIDRSGSMRGDKLNNTKKAVNFAVGHLTGSDHVSIVAFDNRIITVLRSTRVENKDLIKAAVNHLEDGGTTNLSGGLLAGFSEVKKEIRPGQTNRILLLTDGRVNEGIIDHKKLVKMAREISSSGVTLSTFGLGEGFEEDLLISMAEAGGGNFYFIESPDTIPEIFQQELAGLLSITAQNIQLKYTPDHGVVSAAVLGYPSEIDAGTIAVTLPDIYSGEEKVVLFQLNISPQEVGNYHLGSLTMEYADVRNHLAMVTVNVDIKLRVTANPEAEGPMENFEVTKQVELYRAAEAREEAVKLADQGDYKAGRQKLRERLGYVLSMAVEFGDEDLEVEAAELRENLNQMSDDSYDAVARKKMVTQSYMNKRGRRKK
jgi:Ca-activated chloride channel family protein